jgi:hypothetical protein
MSVCSPINTAARIPRLAERSPLKQRLTGLHGLAELPDEDLRKKLAASISEGFRALPDDVQERVHGNIDKGRDLFVQQQMELQKYVRDTKDVEALRVLARLLASGAGLVKIDGDVLAFEIPAKTAASHMQERIKALKKTVATEKIDKLAKEADAKFKGLKSAFENRPARSWTRRPS